MRFGQTVVPAQLSKDSLDRIVISCLSKLPEDRPQSADELAAALRDAGLCSGWTRDRSRQWWQNHRPSTPTGSD